MAETPKKANINTTASSSRSLRACALPTEFGDSLTDVRAVSKARSGQQSREWRCQRRAAVITGVSHVKMGYPEKVP